MWSTCDQKPTVTKRRSNADCVGYLNELGGNMD